MLQWNHKEARFFCIKRKNVIYISLGTVFNQEIDFYNLCFKAFENTDYTVVMSIGGKTQLFDLGEMPEKLYCEKLRSTN